MMDLPNRHMVEEIAMAEVKAATEVAGRHLDRDLGRLVGFFKKKSARFHRKIGFMYILVIVCPLI